jgi:hypothetical protein
MKIIFDRFRCPSCHKSAEFEIRHEPTEFTLEMRRGHPDPDGYVDFFYGRCISCGYNLNLSMAILEEFGERDLHGLSVGPYPCLALERGYVECDPKDPRKTIIRYAYECSMSQRRKQTEAILREAADRPCTVRSQEGEA